MELCFYIFLLGGMKVRRIEIIIPTWNGRDILAQCLPAVIPCLEEPDVHAGITIVDDAGTDGTPEYLAKNFPQVTVLPLTLRRGFPGAVNAGASASLADSLLILNNDMVPDGPVLAPLLEHFDDPDVVAVSARVLKWDRKTIDVGRRLRTFENGEISSVGENEDYPEVSYTFFASGGAMVVDRRRFLELGGFDEIYAPGYVEDTDFCYRAWKRGWKVVWDPRSTFIHMGSATFTPKRPGFRRYVSQCRVRYFLRRNSFYFYWKNLTDSDARRAYWQHLPGRMFKALCAGDLLCVPAFLRALLSLRGLNRRRQEELQSVSVGDAEVFERIGQLCSTDHAEAYATTAGK